MFGWRATIGFISPNPGGLPGSLLEMERLAPEGVAFLTRYLDGPKSLATPDLTEILPQIEPRARSLVRKATIDIVLMAGAPVVLANGPDRVAQILHEATGVPATTNVAGLVNGMRRLDMQKVVVVTPYYPESAVALVRDYLAETGFEIVAMVGGEGTLGTMHELSQEATYRMAKKAMLANPSADGLVIVGGGAPLHDVIETIEVDTGKPVVANNFASLWNALALANVRTPIRGYGKLLTCF
jgi:maleate cis-trans isomerase